MRCHPLINGKKYFNNIQTHFFALKLNKSHSDTPKHPWSTPQCPLESPSWIPPWNQRFWMYVFLSVILNIILKWFRAWENCVSNQNTINKKKGFCFQIYKYSVKQYLEQLRIIFCLLISWLKMSVTGWEETWWDANPGDPERWNRRQSVCLFDLGREELTQTQC